METKNYNIGYIECDIDILRENQMNILKQAKKQCDYLIVGILDNQFVEKTKGKTPIFSFDDRCSLISALKFVDKIIPVISKSKEEQIKLILDNNINVVFVDEILEKNRHWKSIENDLLKHNCHLQFIATQEIDNLEKEANAKIDSNTLANLKKSNSTKYRLGYTTGVFDLFHIGHLNIIKEAKKKCDYLIVGVSTDEVVESYKHKTPIISFEERAAILNDLKYVDFVVPQTSLNKMDAWEKLKFDVMFHGSDWKDSTMYNKIIEEFSKVNVDVVFLNHTDGISSTQLSSQIKKRDK